MKNAPPVRRTVVLYEPKPPQRPPIRIKLPKPIPMPAAAPPKVAPPVKVQVKLPEAPPVPRKVEPVPQIEQPRIEVTRKEAPKVDLPPVPAPAPAPKPMARPAVKTDVFAAAAPAPAGPKATANVKLGGFGDPNGVPASATSNSRMLAKVGSFDLPEGAGNGGGGGHSRVVASAGFGDGGTGGVGLGTGGNGKGSVKTGGFGDTQPAAPAVARSAAPAPPASTPVEILSKPRPVYTAEARAKKLEGEVQLEVVFCSSGEVHVLRVVRGLGMGLDESAAAAASQIRFRPGTRAGAPVDMKGIVHIVFELS